MVCVCWSVVMCFPLWARSYWGAIISSVLCELWNHKEGISQSVNGEMLCWVLGQLGLRVQWLAIVLRRSRCWLRVVRCAGIACEWCSIPRGTVMLSLQVCGIMWHLFWTQRCSRNRNRILPTPSAYDVCMQLHTHGERGTTKN